MSDSRSKCAVCPYEQSKRVCRVADGKGPEGCPTLRHDALRREALNVLEDPAQRELAQQSALQEASSYADREQGSGRARPVKNRIVETMELARRMGFSKLGLIFCVGLRKEAAVVHRLLESHGFEVVSVVCKVGRVPKSELGLTPCEQVDTRAEAEAMCNPIMQAAIVNEEGTDFNVLLGLCVGHDSLFMKHSKAMCTVLAVKDRLLGHNPLAAVYTLDSYSRYLKSSEAVDNPGDGDE
ncbi:MAG: DUF1847 domain-containing protein [Myxococcota bacterium]